MLAEELMSKVRGDRWAKKKCSLFVTEIDVSVAVEKKDTWLSCLEYFIF